jgi:hypothetical protein
VDSLKVDEGCVAIAYEHGDMAGWHAIFPPGEYDGKAFMKAGGKESDLSSLVVVAGTKDDAKAAHNAVNSRPLVHGADDSVCRWSASTAR